MPINRADRLAEFVRRLQAAPHARSFEEAYGQIFRFLNEVEDELSGISYNPLAEKSDGRLYPPLWDNIGEMKGRRRIMRLRSLRHVTLIGSNGAILIQDFNTAAIICSKTGEDGVEIGKL